MIQVKWQKGLDIDDLAINSLLFKHCCNIVDDTEDRAIGNNRNITTFSDNFRDAERHSKLQQVGRQLLF